MGADMTIGRVFRVFIFAALPSFFLLSCSRQEAQKPVPQQPPASAAPLRICTGTTYSILLTIAEQKGLFAQQGLKTEMIPYALGREAMEAMFAGGCDVATSADTPVADYGLKRDDLRILSGIAKSDKLSCIVATRKSGILKVSDLKGRRVGVSKGTAPHFFLNLVLNKNRLREKDVKLAFQKGEELQQNLADGNLDAIVTTDMNAYKMEERLADKVVLISDPGISLNHGYLAVLDATLEKKRDDLRRLLAALKSAEQVVNDSPDEAKRLFTAYLKVSPAISDKIWEDIIPRLSLDSAMVLTLEDNARWLREREGEKPVNKSFRNIIRSELLKELSPERVNF